MKNIDFYGFVVYKVYTNGNIVVNHVYKKNDIDTYNDIVKLMYENWDRKCDNVDDIILLTLPCVNPYGIDKPIFSAKSIGSDHEFDRDNFKAEYYEV